MMNKNIKYIIEKIVNFNPADYLDVAQDIIDDQTEANLVYKYFPESKEELQDIIIEKLEDNIEYPYLNDIDTTKITDMSDLFSDEYLDSNDITSSGIIKLDLSSWNTSNVTDMSCMFDECQSLKQLDLSGWNTSNVTDMSYMFFGCWSLKKLDISNWDTSSVTNMNNMFCGCRSLKELNISGWNVSNVTDMD